MKRKSNGTYPRLDLDAIRRKPHKVVSTEEALKDVEPYVYIFYQCEDCGEFAEHNKQKSNNNRIAYDAKCAKCGGKVRMRLWTPPPKKENNDV